MKAHVESLLVVCCSVVVQRRYSLTVLRIGQMVIMMNCHKEQRVEALFAQAVVVLVNVEVLSGEKEVLLLLPVKVTVEWVAQYLCWSV